MEKNNKRMILLAAVLASASVILLFNVMASAMPAFADYGYSSLSR